MKNIFIISFAVLSILLTGSCKKKKTAETVDPCATTNCLNGGICNDGSCACPIGYSGADCGTQRTPTVTITSIKNTNFPALDGGSTWNSVTATNPDMFVVLKKVSTGATIFTSGTVTDAASGTSYVFPGITATAISDFTSQYTLELWDYDSTSANDPMGNITFDMYTSSNHFPAVMTVTSGSITYEISLSYAF